MDATDGDPPPRPSAAEVESARRALFRREASVGDRERYRRLVAQGEPGRRSSPDPSSGRRPGRTAVRASARPVRPLLLVGALALVALAAPVLAGGPALTVVDRPVRAGVRVLGEEVEVPVGWAGARVVAADRRLDGARALVVRAGAARALLVVRCPAADRSFQVVVADRPTRYGACGPTALVDLGPLAPGAAVVVTARGPLAFAAAVLRR